jgi:putative nucleotidyltransferase with HDIG domain
LLGVLPCVLPELLELKAVSQSPPHTKDVWGHTLDTLRNLELLLDVFQPRHDPEKSSSLITGLAVMRLGRYRHQITEHLQSELIVGRSKRSILFLAALYHDIAKPKTKTIDDAGRIRFFNHDQLGVEIIRNRSDELHLSNTESDYLEKIIKHHMRPTHLAREQQKPSARAIYRFFRDAGEAGVDICLLSLADILAAYGTTLPQKRWEIQLDVVRELLAAWWEEIDTKIDPPVLITGSDLINEFHLKPGPVIGEILELIREGQVSGEIVAKEDGLSWVREYLHNK